MAHYDRYSRPNWTESNAGQYKRNDYNDVFSEKHNEQLSTQSDPSVLYQSTVNYLTVSSKSRDITNYSATNAFTINFPQAFRNVHSIQLVQAIIPDKNSVTSEPYLLLKIKELEGQYISLDRHVNDAFCMLKLPSAPVSGTFIKIDDFNTPIRYFKTPMASLNRMSISITKEDGTLFDFGNDTPTPPNKTYQNTFIFKIVTVDKSHGYLNTRIVT